MNFHDLALCIERPEIHRQLLGNYNGSYSLGVTRDPEDPQKAAIRVRVEGDGPAIPDAVSIDSENVQVIAHSDFTPPVPQ